MLHIVALADVPSQPWRNGGGSTQELLTWPAPVDWLVRISVARIEQHGPFSAFPGIQRWFTVIHGAGVRLLFEDTEVVLSAESDPLRFDGAAAPGCELLDDATQDLNLMVRADGGRGTMQRANAVESWVSPAGFRGIYTAGPAALRIDDDIPYILPANSLAWRDDAGAQRWQLVESSVAAPVRAWWIEFTPRAENLETLRLETAPAGPGQRQ